jgi:hypothetical protein
MLVMAIEAAKQIIDQSMPMIGFNVENVTFRAAIRIPSGSEGVETSLHLRPAQDLESKRSKWFNFKLCTLYNESWTENCTGSIQVLFDDKVEEIDMAIAAELQNSRRDAYAAAVADCKLNMSGEAMYDTLQNNGYGYGTAFQLVTELSRDSLTQSATAVVRNFSSSCGETVHPTTLDAIFQTSIWMAVPCGAVNIPTAVPTHIDRLWVDIEATTSQSFKTYGSCVETSQFIGPTTSIVVLDHSLRKTLVSVHGLRMSIINSPDLTGSTGESLDKLCHQISWKPELKLLSDLEIMQLCKAETPNDTERTSFLNALDFLLMVRITEALSHSSGKGVQASQPHLKKYHNWLIHRQKLLEETQREVPHDEWRSLMTDRDYIQKVEQRVRATKQGYVYASVAQDLTKFLSGELDPSTCFKDEDMLNEVYHEAVSVAFRDSLCLF